MNYRDMLVASAVQKLLIKVAASEAQQPKSPKQEGFPYGRAAITAGSGIGAGVGAGLGLELGLRKGLDRAIKRMQDEYFQAGQRGVERIEKYLSKYAPIEALFTGALEGPPAARFGRAYDAYRLLTEGQPPKTPFALLHLLNPGTFHDYMTKEMRNQLPLREALDIIGKHKALRKERMASRMDRLVSRAYEPILARLRGYGRYIRPAAVGGGALAGLGAAGLGWLLSGAGKSGD